jgi:hypothetical protein
MTLVTGDRAVDPAEQAAQLLFRVGFGILCIVLPAAAVFSRRAMVVIAPIGAIILIFAALMMKGKTDAGSRVSQALVSPAALAALFLVVWSALSLTWTPYPGPGAERLFRVVGSVGIALGAITALPERMRVSNLYLLTIGVGAAALLALGVALAKPSWSDPVVMERAAVLISLMAWPSVTWLSMKRRSVPAMGIAGVVGALAIVLQGPAVLPALLVGAVLLGGALNNLRGAAAAFMSAAVILILGAPVIALVLSLLTQQESVFGRTMQVWADVIVADPSRLLTGHGLETALRNRISQALDTSAPTSLLFEIWYELGVLGALGTAAVIVLSVLQIAQGGRTVGAFALGCMGFAFTLAVMGLGTSQTWWVTALATTCIVFMAVVHGEYRTERPVARSGAGIRLKEEGDFPER